MKKLGLLLAVVMLLGACASPAPEATPTPVATPIPAPTDTPAPLATPTSPALAEASFIEPIRKQIFAELVDAQGGIAGNEEVRATVAQRWGISVDAAEEIVLEGITKGWFMPTPPVSTPVVPTSIPTPTLKPPTLTPRPTEMAGVSKEEGALAEEAYKKEVCKVTKTYADVVSGLFRLVGAGGAVGYSQKPEELLGEEFPWSFSIYANGAYPPVPSRWEKEVAHYVSAYQEWVELEGKMLHTLEPPASYQDAHQELVQATKQIDHAVVFLLEVTGEVNAIYKSIRDDRSAQATKAFENVTPGAVSLIIYDEEVSEANTEKLRQAQDKLKQVAVEMYTAGLVLFSTPICDRR